MIFLRKEEAHSHLIKKLDAFLGALIDVYSQCLKAISGAAL